MKFNFQLLSRILCNVLELQFEDIDLEQQPEVDLPKDFSTIALSERMREIERNTSEPLDGMEQLLEEIFKSSPGQLHFPKMVRPK